MKRKEFLNTLENIMELDEDTLKGDEVLIDMREWDSIAFLSVIAMLDEHFNIIIQGDKLEQITRVTDLLALVSDKLED
jgi:acyl carrier protein